ncbi:glycosyltransferase family 4 protein [Ferroplasma sp.]|jgi:glycosyltransferase involved in cell wall biosynthesis|uniref:glycosyltransferase family 4 protein n=1 Tax=Ferroplasma sp. TaxID=2591003 RepID=UPI0026035ED5|nr:glycosyltransferase family 4 protein [Ferroplasma sp.]
MRLTFFMPVDLRVNRGTENVLFNLLKYKPNDIEITIIEPTRTGTNPLILSNSEVNELTRGAKIIRIHSKLENLEKYNNSKFGTLYRELIAKPELYSLKHTPKENLKEIKDTDIVYLFHSRFAIFFNDTYVPIVGSEHIYAFSRILTNRNKNILNKISYNLIYKIYYKNISFFHLFMNRKNVINDLKQYFNFKLKEIMILPNGVDTSFFYPDYSINNVKIKFLFVASLKAEKGLDILLPLIDKIDNNCIEFHIAGGGKLSDKIKTNKRIIYHGILSDIDLAKLYRECDVFIYPSHNDVFPTVTLQALSSGLYVICSDYLKGNFDDFENKYLEYLPLDVEKWYSRINEIINDNNIIKHNKKEEYIFVKNNYDWKIISTKFYEYMVKFYNNWNEI